MNKKEILSSLKQLDFKKGTIKYYVSQLILTGKFSQGMYSTELCQVINEKYGRPIDAKDLLATLRPLLNAGVLTSKLIGKGRNKKRIWFPTWCDKKDVEKKMFAAKASFAVQLPTKVLSELPKEIREAILDDVVETNKCIPVEAWKAVCMLCGRMSETFLLHYFISFDKKYPGNTDVRKILGALLRKQQIGYDNLMTAAQQINLIKDNDLTKNFLDLVIACRHPSVHFRGQKLNLNEKKVAALVKSTEIIFEDIYKNAKSLKIHK